MSTKIVHNKKRKCVNSGSNRQKRNRRQPQLIYQVKAIEVSPRKYHYFAKTYNSQVEERLESGWMDKNYEHLLYLYILQFRSFRDRSDMPPLATVCVTDLFRVE